MHHCYKITAAVTLLHQCQQAWQTVAVGALF